MALPESATMKIGILCLVVGLVIHIIAFSVPHWYTDPGINVHGGLWVVCSPVFGCDATPDNVGSVFHFVQAMEAMALIFALLGAASVLWVIKSPSVSTIRILKSLTSVSGVFVLCGVVTFMVKFSDDKAWGAYLEFPAGVLLVVAGVMFCLEARRPGAYEALQ